jgi:hypothetical protein
VPNCVAEGLWLILTQHGGGDRRPRLVPDVDLKAQLAQPDHGLQRSAANRADFVRLGQPVQHQVGAQPRDIVDTPGPRARQQRGRWIARINSDLGHIAETFARPLDNVEDHIRRALGGTDITRPQQGIEHVTRLRNGDSQWVVDPGIVMAL